MDWLHRFLVPSEKNGYRPTSLESTASAIMLVLVMLTFAIANVQSILLVSSDWFVSTILPAALVDMTNDNRDENKLPELRRSALLDEAARLKAEDMAKNGYFSHDSPDGVTPWHWFKEVGYTYAYAGENLAVHFSDSEDVVDAWMASPGHRANILGGDYREIGIGTAKGVYKGSPTVFVVQLFGTPVDAMVAVPTEKTVVVDTPSVRAPRNAEVLAVRDRSETPAPHEAPVERVELPTKTPAATTVTEPATEELSVEQDEDVPSSVPDANDTAETLETAKGSSTPDHEEPVVAKSLEGEMSVDVTPMGTVVYSSMATTGSPSVASLRSGPAVPPSESGHIASFFTRLLASPHTFISLAYLTLTLVVATMLTISVVVEWRRQHPVQVAYAVGLAGIMLIALQVHLALTTGAHII